MGRVGFFPVGQDQGGVGEAGRRRHHREFDRRFAGIGGPVEEPDRQDVGDGRALKGAFPERLPSA